MILFCSSYKNTFARKGVIMSTNVFSECDVVDTFYDGCATCIYILQFNIQKTWF